VPAATLEFVVPFHGDPGYLRETVRSVLDQTHPDWSLVVIDDGNHDPSAAGWVGELSDDRVRLVRHEVNQGANATYREALRTATRDYVVVLGADDRLLPTYAERVLAVIARTGASVVQPGVRVIDADGRECRPVVDRAKARLRPAGRPEPYRGEAVAATLLQGNWTYFPSLCWHRATVAEIGFRDFDVIQDLGLLVDVLMRGGTLAVDDEVVFEYRRHLSSDSALRAASGGRFEDERRYFTDIAGELRARSWHRASRAARIRPLSRAHAASLLPAVAARGDLPALGRLTRHVAGR
jgi:glycosyltransferase involved in cell wall biosynthesis